MFCVSARAKYALVVDIYSYISRIGCIAKPIANPIATLWGLWERLITRTTKLVSSEFSGAVLGTAYISRPTSIASTTTSVPHPARSTTNAKGHNILVLILMPHWCRSVLWRAGDRGTLGRQGGTAPQV